MEKPTRVLIVGGGSSGWMAASYLNALLHQIDSDRVEISLIESPDTPRSGVARATTPSIRKMLSIIDIDFIDFMKSVNGTYKQSTRYDNWLDNAGEYYHHPFTRYPSQPVDLTGEFWLRSNRSIPFMETTSPQPLICELGLAPRPMGSKLKGPRLKFAYHLNALKFADYLCEHSKERGVTHYVDNVTDVEMRENGEIEAIKTESGNRIEADLFVDCTGFTGLLCEKALDVKWVDFSKWLICDRALVMPVPYEAHYPGFVRSHTMASAMSSGWIWDIPLQDRRGVGYVHSSSFISEEEAEREIRGYEGAHADNLDTQFVDFKAGMREKAWFKNCIAIGHSGGFIEPLESTGLYLSQVAIEMLAEHFPRDNNSEPLAFRVNRVMQNRFHEILDFINMHYCLTRRTDTEFWREVGRPERVTDRLQAKLDYWRMKPPSVSDFSDQFLPGMKESASPSDSGDDTRTPIDTAGLWNHSSYQAILYGMDFLSEECDAWYGKDRPPSATHSRTIEALQRARDTLPKHDVFLREVLNMPHYSGD